MKLTVHAAKIPENAQSLTPTQRRLRGVQYLNACNDKRWIAPPSELLGSPQLQRCEACAVVVSYQPGRSDQRASIRPRHQS